MFGKIPYRYGDKMISVRELLLRAFVNAWQSSGSHLTKQDYVSSSIHVLETMQVEPESVYCEEGQGLLEGEPDHLDDLLRADGVWLYYGVSAENFFLLQWMPDAESAAAKLAQLREDPDCLCFAVDLAVPLEGL